MMRDYAPSAENEVLDDDWLTMLAAASCCSAALLFLVSAWTQRQTNCVNTNCVNLTDNKVKLIKIQS